MKVMFDIDNPKHVEDFKKIACQKFREMYFPDWRIIEERYKIPRDSMVRTSLKPDYDKTNPEHVEFFMTHQVKESMLRFNCSSLRGVYKTQARKNDVGDWKTERKRKLPPIRDRELKNDTWKREEMNFSDMKPLS